MAHQPLLPRPFRACLCRHLSALFLLLSLLLNLTARSQCEASITIGGGGNGSICEGSSVTLTASPGDSYLWSNGATTRSITVSQPGIFSVDVTVNGCTATSQLISVRVTPQPVFNPIPTVFCSNDNTPYLALTGPVSIVRNSLGISFSGVPDAYNVLFTPSEAPVGPGFFTVEYQTGCSATFNYTILQAPVLQLTQALYSVCAPATVNLQTVLAPSSILPAGTTLEYFFHRAPVPDPSAVSLSGIYTIRATSPDGCVTEKEVPVTINQPPVFNNIPGSFCSNDNTEYLATTGPVSVVQNSFGISFSGSPGAYNVLFNPSAVSPGPGFFTVVLTNGCSSTFNYTVLQAPHIELTQSSLSVCTPNTANLPALIGPSSVLPAGTTVEYLLNGTAVPDPAAVAAAGTYTIRATGPGGCVEEKQVAVSFNSPPVFNNIPTTFCSNDHTEYLATTGPVSVVQNSFGISFSGSPGAYNVLFNPSELAPGPGFFTVVLTSGCSATFTYTVLQAPSIQLTQPSLSVCAPAAADLTSLIDPASVLPAGTTIEYLKNGVPVPDPHAVTANGSYTIRATAPGGCTDEQTVAVAINAPPVFNNIPTTFCSSDHTQYLAVTGPVSVVQNSFGISFSGSPGAYNVLFDPSAVAPGPGFFTVVFTTGCSATFHYVVDPPAAITQCPADITVPVDGAHCGAVVNYTAPVLSSTCGGATLTRTAGPASGSLFPVGTTPITYTMTQANGATQTCSFTVTVIDNLPPLLSCAGTQTLNTLPGQCHAFYNGRPEASDNCSGVTLTGVRSDGQPLSAPYPAGTTRIQWTARDAAGNATGCTQEIRVIDAEAPVLSCATAPAFCFQTSGTYTVPAVQASDNCGIQSISYQVSGATSRSGTGSNASGVFNPGISLITWTVTDVHGNSRTCQTSVGVDPLVTLSIPDARALPAGVDPNTVYLGYQPAQSITLTAVPGGGTPPYAFHWNTGQTTPSITVSPVAGTLYTVTVTDARGCSRSVGKFINVVDVRCGNKNDKVLVCKLPPGNPANGHAICVSPNAVPAQLADGSYLGACSNATIAVAKPVPDEKQAVLALAAHPNPSASIFTLDVKVSEGLVAELVVYDALGKTLEKRIVSSGPLTIGGTYRPGVYFAVLRQGNRSVSVKLIRQSD